MNQHQKEVAKRMLERAQQRLDSFERTLEYSQDVDRWGPNGNGKMYEKARLGVLRFREKVAKLKVKLTPAGEHLPGAYTYRTNDQQLIGRIFTPTSRQDFVEALRQYRHDLGSAPVETDPLADLSESSRRYIEQWISGDGPDNSHRRA